MRGFLSKLPKLEKKLSHNTRKSWSWMIRPTCSNVSLEFLLSHNKLSNYLKVRCVQHGKHNKLVAYYAPPPKKTKSDFYANFWNRRTQHKKFGTKFEFLSRFCKLSSSISAVHKYRASNFSLNLDGPRAMDWLRLQTLTIWKLWSKLFGTITNNLQNWFFLLGRDTVECLLVMMVVMINVVGAARG